MATLNIVHLIGNLTRDPELRVTPKGTPICQFGLAVNRQFKDESGAQRDETTFVDIEAWGKQGELCAKYLIKGAPAYIAGRLRMDQWEDKQTGQKRSRLKVVLTDVQFLGRRPDADQSDGQEEYQAPPPRRPPTPPPADYVDEDVPF